MAWLWAEWKGFLFSHDIRKSRCSASWHRLFFSPDTIITLLRKLYFLLCLAIGSHSLVVRFIVGSLWIKGKSLRFNHTLPQTSDSNGFWWVIFQRGGVHKTDGVLMGDFSKGGVHETDGVMIGDFFKGGSTQNQWGVMGDFSKGGVHKTDGLWFVIFQRGEYTKPMGSDGFWNIFYCF